MYLAIILCMHVAVRVLHSCALIIACDRKRAFNERTHLHWHCLCWYDGDQAFFIDIITNNLLYRQGRASVERRESLVHTIHALHDASWL